MGIKWDSLVDVSLASFGVTIAVVVLFSLGIAAWSRADGLSGDSAAAGGTARVAAVLCFAACLAVAAFGIDIIVPG
ncbi:hypothetical protein [Streptomyces bluensis]|uniref:Integral membrane protein n=1 Tax=Streptomyces bluensis TaxID=33897 RepID=A0ABW6UVG6_9ACTN|nr:hypothetical protein [Streptomyces bluensis]GGZ86881.1 hypothetical protein GCM10010344_63000 [Streptomyces bluensis]